MLEAGTITPDGAATLTTTLFPAIPICDVDLAHSSHIGDEEDSRFQLGVDVYGYERDRHEGRYGLPVGGSVSSTSGEASIFAS